MLIAGPNLTIDRTLTGGELRPGEVLRFAAAAGPGGKGLNVARGAQALGAPRGARRASCPATRGRRSAR